MLDTEEKKNDMFVVVDLLEISSEMFTPQDVIGIFFSEKDAQEYGEKNCSHFEVFQISEPDK